MSRSFNFEPGRKVWIYKDGEEEEAWMLFDSWKEEAREFLNRYYGGEALFLLKKLKEVEPPTMIAVGIVRETAEPEARPKMDLSEEINETLFQTIARLNKELDG
ncbi:MAG: hypothetical protein HPY61_09550 [Methanotrichaceae archaeon]|nr:hypothetical protein [Methanotrichaceae archaeon]